ncbi:Nucleotidyl transferase of unknown function [Paenibacillaceae bacterium GAS479]|nr:Nucleotidyl transferase of unknown function [Paenibacillaceae bacterium GAS479]
MARVLNNELDIAPVLYGSLGLQFTSGIDLEPQDIDVLVPLEYLQEKWDLLQQAVEKIGYTFVDLHEHEFRKEGFKLAFAFIEDLADFANVDYKKLERIELDGAKFQALRLEDYLKVYSKSLIDGYRGAKNNNKDVAKIELIKTLLERDKHIEKIKSLYGSLDEADKPFLHARFLGHFGGLHELESGDWIGWSGESLKQFADIVSGYVLTIKKVPDLIEAYASMRDKPLPSRVEFGPIEMVEESDEG